MFNRLKFGKMKKIFTVIGLALAALTVSCSKDVDVQPAGNKVVLGVSIEADTRTALGELNATTNKYDVVWSEGDCLAVNGVASEAVAASFVGKTNAEFVVNNVAAPYSVLYPAQILNQDGTITVPSVQAYAEGTFANGSAVAVGYAEGTAVTLKNLYSFVKITIAKAADETLKSVVLKAEGGEAISGIFNVDYQNAAISAVAGQSVIRVEDVPYGADGKAVVYFAVPAGSYPQGFSVTVADAAGKAMTKKSTKVTEVPAGYLLNMPEFTYAGVERTETVITTGAELQQFIDTDAAEFTGVALLGNDIDMTGIILTTPAVLKAEAVFDGQGYAIKNWTSSTGLFYENYGTIKNVVLDETCNLTFNLEDNTNLACGFIVNANLGLVSGCINNAAISFNDPNTAVTQNRFLGAIVGCIGQGMVNSGVYGDPDKYTDYVTYKNARIENCINNGAITVNIAGYDSGWLYLGGVAGAYLPHAETSDGGAYNCVNNGDVNIYAGTNNKITVVGGVIGSAGKLYSSANNNKIEYYCKMENCVNTGNISYSCLAQGQQLYYGGVAGATFAQVTSCRNSGKVLFSTDPETVKPTLYVAGVSGVSSGSFADCHNDGDVVIDNIIFGYWAAAAGISARCFNYNPITVSGCTNSGKIDVTIDAAANQTHNFGGILAIVDGATTDITNCHNTASAVIKMVATGTGAAGANIGGIVAKLTKESAISDCTNSGKIEIDTQTEVNKNSYLGGIAGSLEGAVTNVINCQNTESAEIKMSVTGTAAIYGCIGGVVGNNYKAGATMTDCVNKGSLSLSGMLAKNSNVGGLVGTNCNSFVNCQSLGAISLANASENVALVGGVACRLNDSTCAWDGCVVNCPITYTGNCVFGLLQADTWLSTLVTTLGATTPNQINKATTVNGEAVATLDWENLLLGRDQMLENGTVTETSFQIAEGGVVLVD